MKNLHVLPTDKPSRLHLYTDEKGTILETCELEYSNTRNTQHIYITNSEEIKFNDYITDGYKIWQWKDDSSLLGRKKVILTTDQDLIKDGVQKIDDDFLEWFIKNPSCEMVEVDKNWNYPLDKSWEYKIIIPQEEPKQEHCDCKRAYKEVLSGICELCWDEKYPTKQETLKEAAENYGWRIKRNTFSDAVKANELAESAQQDFIEGANWQQERMYSEEDMIEFGKYLLQLSNSAMSRKFNMKMLDSETGIKLTKDLFEQYKKK